MEASILKPDSSDNVPDWRAEGQRFYSYNFFLKNRFGCRVQKISLDGGFTCPNVDGSVAIGGCTFCDNRAFSPSRRVRRSAISEQIERGIVGLKRRYQTEKFLAYFQPASNTYAPVEKLRVLYTAALEDSRIVGLVIGTRPDCVPDEVLDLVDSFSERTYVSLELGMQTMHNTSLDWMNRGHHHEAFVNAMTRVAGRNFETSVHVMLGLPGETHEMMMQTACEVACWNPHGVKIHNLYAVERTPLADQVRGGQVRLLDMDEYIEILADFLEILPISMVIERISGDAPPENLVGPAWCLHKGSIKAKLIEVLERRGTVQGSKHRENHKQC